MRRMILKSFSFVVLVCLIALGLAYLVSDQSAAWFLGVAFLAYAASNLFHINALLKWAALREKREMPSGFGLWGTVFNRIRRGASTDFEAKQAARLELDRVHAAVDQLPDGLIVVDQYDHIVWYNNAARELHEIFGLNRPVHHFIRQPEFFNYLAEPNRTDSIKLSLASRPGRVFELKAIAAAESQKLLVTRDITEAAKLDAMRRDFVANVSHEIRTPVTVIGGFAETLLTLELDEESRSNYLTTILKQSQNMQRLLEDLLTLSSLESSDTYAVSERINMHQLLDTLLAEARSLSQGGHTITSTIEGPVFVLGAQTELETAIRNLIVNALRYTPKGGTVNVTWSSINTFDNSQCAWLRVSDTGPGIAAEHIPRLTERFYRVDRGRSRETGGTGLGLAIVKHIVQRHGGDFVIESELGRGSRFSVGMNHKRLVVEQLESIA